MTMQTTRRICRHILTAAGASGVLLLAVQAPAQTPTMPRNQAEFEKAIGLTADQKKRMEAINKKYQPKFKAVESKYKPKMEALQKQMQALQQQAQAEAKPILTNFNKEIESVLTASQREKIKQFQQQAQQQRGGG